MTIEDYYDICGDDYEYHDDFNNKYVKNVNNDDITLSVSNDKKLNVNKINYVMKHKVKKRLFKITVNGKSVVVTEDHSLVVLRGNELKKIIPKYVMSGDIFINI